MKRAFSFLLAFIMLVSAFLPGLPVKAGAADKIISNASIEAAIAWGESFLSPTDSSKFHGLCAAFVFHAYNEGAGISNSSYSTATAMGNALITHTDKNPPRGAFVFWYIPNEPAGHVALSLGDGKIIHAWGSKPKCVVTGTVTNVTNYYGASNYRGWGAPIAGYTLATESTIPVNSIFLDVNSAVLDMDEILQISAIVYPENATDKSLEWTSSNSAVATVSSTGLVTPKSEGEAVIGATANDGSGVYAAARVTVMCSHTFETTTVPGIDPTCTESGLSDGKTCKACGATVVSQIILPATGHSWGAWTGAFSGTETRTCSGCGETEHRSCDITGTCGDNLTWSLNAETGVLRISGTGDMGYYWEPYVAPWSEYRESIKEIVIDSGVTSVGAGAFGGSSNLLNVTIPESITTIGEYAFQVCRNLTSITIPEGVTTIGECAFYYCDKATQIVLPSTLARIGESAFEGCSSETVYYRGTAEQKNAISIDEWNEDILYAEWVVEFCRFSNNGTAANHTWGAWTEGTAGIQTRNCSVCSITETRNIISGTCGTNLTWCFDPDTGELRISGTGDMTDFGNEESVAWYSFRKSIKKAIIADGVTSIGANAFCGCSELTSVTIPDSVTSIGYASFYECTTLKKVSIPAGVVFIDEWAFYDCGSLTSIKIPLGVTEIPGAAFYSCDMLTSVSLPDSIISIGDWAFAECYDLSSLDVPDSVSHIGEWAFYDCQSLTDFRIPKAVTKISSATFFRCYGLTNMTIPESVTEIMDRAFLGCVYLSSISIPESVTSIGEMAFCDCESLEDIYYSGSESQRKNISIASDNEFLEEATWHCQKQEELAAPTIKISADTTSGKPKLTWSAVSGADFYRIYRAVGSTGSYSYLKSTRSTSFTDTSAVAGTNYYYKVKAVVEETDETSAYSNIVNRCCDLAKPVVTLKVDTASGKPKVTFEKITGAEKYYIVRSTSKTGTYSKLATITGTSYIDKTAKVGTNYYYKVKALHAKDAADSAYSDITNRVCDLAKPVVSQSVNTTSGKPVVKWETVEGAAKYRVYRSTQKDSGYELVYTAVTARTYIDKTAEAGTNYYYKVKAVHTNSSADSAYSAVVNRVCDLAKPVISITRSNGDPKVSWETVEGAEKYEIWRATSKTGTYKKVKTAITARSFMDTNVTAGKTYYYKVRAIHNNSAANSAYSSIKYITAK